MAYRFGLLQIVLLTAALLAPVTAKAGQEQDPVATATIPPPAPAAAASATAPQKPLFVSPMAAAPAKKQTRTAARKPRTEPTKHVAVRKHTRQVKRERHQLYARAYPSPPRPQYYPRPPMPSPEAEGPSMPPGWYDRGPPIDYPYPGYRRMGMGPW
jgi:hypothetical protein